MKINAKPKPLLMIAHMFVASSNNGNGIKNKCFSVVGENLSAIGRHQPRREIQIKYKLCSNFIYI